MISFSQLQTLVVAKIQSSRPQEVQEKGSPGMAIRDLAGCAEKDSEAEPMAADTEIDGFRIKKKSG